MKRNLFISISEKYFCKVLRPLGKKMMEYLTLACQRMETCRHILCKRFLF